MQKPVRETAVESHPFRKVREKNGAPGTRQSSSAVPLAGQLSETRKRLRMTNNFATYGFPDQCRKFEQRHPLWQEIMPNLERALNLAFTRVEVMSGSSDKFVYFFGRVCLEGFMEILLV